MVRAIGDSTAIGARHVGSGIVKDGILIVRSPCAPYLKPMVCRSRKPIGRKRQVASDAHRIIITHQRRKDGTVGGGLTIGLAEMDVTSAIGVIGNQQDIILAFLCIPNLASFVPVGRITTRNDHRPGQSVGTRLQRVVERSPAAEVDVDLRRTVHIDIHVTWVEDAHIIPRRIGTRPQAVVIRSRFASARIDTSGELIQAVIGAKRFGSVAKIIL